MKKIALILCLVLVASFVLSGCNNSDSIITLEDREVGKIEIQSGNTGETVEVTEEEVISQIADILSLEFEKGEKSNDSTGRALHSHNPTQYSNIVWLTPHFYSHIRAGH